MKMPNSPQSPSSPQKFKFVVEAPAASFSREFATIKSMTQYKRRNPNLKGEEYVYHENKWQRFVIHGSKVIPATVVYSLLSSLKTPLFLEDNFEAPDASTTNQIPQNPIN